MRFIDRHSDVPAGPGLLARIDAAAGQLAAALPRVDAGALGMSDYGAAYLRRHVARLRSSLERQARILALSLSGCGGEPEDVVFLDVGGGVGMASLLARAAGVGHVIHNDIDPACTEDARVLGAALGLSAEIYHCGEVREAIDAAAATFGRCDAIASCDVVEHVYDTEGFLRALAAAPAGRDLTVVMSTDANDRNPLIRMSIRRKQRAVETRDRRDAAGRKRRDSLAAYRTLRREIIRSHAPSLREEDVERMARATRGLREDDIREAVDAFRHTTRFPEEPSHPTNTCDPRTGNWAERLMAPESLAAVLEGEGFRAEVLPGYYGRSGGPARRILAGLLNGAIRLLGREGIRIAPNVLVVGHRPGRRRAG